MVKRGDVLWATLEEPFGRRPVCVVTRTAAIASLYSVMCAPITRRIRGIRSEVVVGPCEGLPDWSTISCDNLILVSHSELQESPVGSLDSLRSRQLDLALGYALGIDA